MVPQLVFAGLVVVTIATLVFVQAVSQDAGIPIIAAALGYVFGAGAEKGADQIRHLRNNGP